MENKELNLIKQALTDSKKMEFNINNEKYVFYLSYNANLIIMNLNKFNLTENYDLKLTLKESYKINKFFLF